MSSKDCAGFIHMIKFAVWMIFPLIAILMEGIKRKLIARMQNRVGPPLLQPLYDIWKLFHKEGTNGGILSIIPIFALIGAWAIFLFFPLQIISFKFDFIFVFYVYIFVSITLILAGIASNSPYGIIGSMREMTLMIAYEFTFFICMFTFFLYGGAESFAMLPEKVLIAKVPLTIVALLCVILIEHRITPFDTASAPSEIMAGYTTQYAGRDLAFFELAEMTKKLAVTSIFAFLTFPHNLVWFGIVTTGMYFVCAAARVTSPRFRVDQALGAFATILFLAFINFLIFL